MQDFLKLNQEECEVTENMNIIGNAGIPGRADAKRREVPYKTMSVSSSIPGPTDAERREGAIRTALFVLASSLILPVLSYLGYLW